MSTPPDLSKAPSLPADFTRVRQVLDEETKVGSLITMVAMVKDCRRAVATTGSDHKSTLRLYDSSTQKEGHQDLAFNIFRPEDDMPQVGVGDVLILHSVKVQRFKSDSLSLITNRATSIHVYNASEIPQYPTPAHRALKPNKERSKPQSVHKAEAYISWMYHNINKTLLPNESEFEQAATRSLQVKQKFCLLKDIEEYTFVDMVVEVVKDPFDLGDKMTLWVSDYTENQAFFDMSLAGGGLQDSEEGDSAKRDGFTGPFGKQCLQVTCWEPHATFVQQNNISKGDWLQLRNVHVKMGSNFKNLEGFLREDRGAIGNKTQVDILDTSDPDSKLKDALYRKLSYWKGQKKELKEIRDEGRGKKRQASNPLEGKGNSKQRRAQKRANLQQKERQKEQETDQASLGLNPHMKCENMNQPTTSVEQILERPIYQTQVHRQETKMQLPFTCVKFRTNVRVVDFFPPKLEDFACSRKTGEFDALSNVSGSLSTDSESDETDDLSGGRIWEWRFALCLEDAAGAAKGNNRHNLWAVVGDLDAQHLTDLDACNLRTNQGELNKLRDRFFTLWGDLEEVKTRSEEARAMKAQQKQASGRSQRPDRPADSSDIEDDSNAAASGNEVSEVARVSNRSFSCCIQQYGIKVDESDPRKATAGKGKKWDRVFGLFGTKIYCA